MIGVHFHRDVLMLIIFICIVIGFATPIKAEAISFTQEEMEFLDRGDVLKAVTIEGAAPLHYRDSKGNIKGIAINTLKEIEKISGLEIEYYLYKSSSELLNSDFDIIIGISEEYAVTGIAISIPYLETETVLFYNKSINTAKLKEEKYAAVVAGTLPDGVKKEQAIYYNDREETMNAVEAGKAGYGYGNAYSVAFYLLQNGYNNIFTVPTGKGDRAYCMGVSEENEILLSILNKAIAEIDTNRMDTIILDVTSQIERKVTLPMVIDIYGLKIFTATSLIMLVLAYLAFSNSRAKNRYRMENKRFQLLSNLSNEYMFEYQIKTGSIKLAEKIKEELEYFGNKEEVISLVKNFVKGLEIEKIEDNPYILKLPITKAEMRTFRVVLSYLRDHKGKTQSLIGKLIDISEDEREKKKLIEKSQMDGLTGLYNASTVKEMVVCKMNNRPQARLDALIIIDCDNLKMINDSQGHLVGDDVLKAISRGLKLTFRETDIMGRIGGDEFCVYMENIPSADYANLRCQQLIRTIKGLNKSLSIDISIGIAVSKAPLSYEDLFKEADDALYKAKDREGSQVIVFEK